MFYLIRMNRRDKPHSRACNDNISKIIHAQVTKGQISITQKAKKLTLYIQGGKEKN